MEEKNKKSRLKIFIIILLIILIIIGIGFVLYINSMSLDDFISHEMELLPSEMTLRKFNSQFNIYEGIKTVTQIKQLIKTVSSSNMSNPEQQVKLIFDNTSGAILWTETIDKSDGIEIYKYKEIDGIVNSKKYEVLMNTGNDGRIETITVTEKNN